MGEAIVIPPAAILLALGVGSATLGFFLDPFGLWGGIFGGVPRDAKTAGAGAVLANSHYALNQIIGANLLRGVKNGRILSEPGTPQSLESGVAALAFSLAAQRNEVPNGPFWTTVSQQPGGLEMALEGIPPPAGAPYGDSVGISEIGIRQPLAAAEFQTETAHPPITEAQLVHLFTQGHLPWFDDPRVDRTSFDTLYRSFYILVNKVALPLFISQPGGTPPPAPTLEQIVSDISDCLCTLEQAVVSFVAAQPPATPPQPPVTVAPTDLTPLAVALQQFQANLIAAIDAGRVENVAFGNALNIEIRDQINLLGAWAVQQAGRDVRPNIDALRDQLAAALDRLTAEIKRGNDAEILPGGAQ